MKQKIFSAALSAALLLGALSGCAGGLVNNVNDGTVNTNLEQTEFNIMGGISALSSGYENNEVLTALQERAGIHITWETMSDSLAEQVNIRVTGGQYPDAFMGVGFSNYDLARYGDDGTFLDLTPYLTPDIMPNLCAILEEHPEIRAAITQEDGKIYGLPSGEQMITSGQLNITNKCKSPINLLKFYDLWYNGETVMQLQYGPIGVFFTGQDESGMWLAITEEEAQAKYGKSAGEVRNAYETMGPKLILAEYYNEVFYMEDRAVERLTDLDQFWMPYVKDTSFYPVDCVFTGMEMETIDWHKADFEAAVKEQEGLWLRDGGPTDAEWQAYKDHLSQKCGMDDLLQVYQDAYDRYAAAK